MADTKLSALTAASALDGTELFYGAQGGNSRKITTAQVKTLTSASPTLVTPNLGTPSAGVLTNCSGYVFPSSAFASLPAAASSTGLIYSVSDISGALFRSNGTRWLPVGGSVLLYQKCGSIASPLATITGATAAQFSISGGFPIIPAGVLAQHSRVRVIVWTRKNGANATAVLNARCGTAGTTSDSLIQARTITNADNQQVLYYNDIFFSSTTVFTTHNTGSWNAQMATGVSVDRTTNVNAAAAMTVSVDISAGSASDSHDLFELAVELWP